MVASKNKEKGKDLRSAKKCLIDFRAASDIKYVKELDQLKYYVDCCRGLGLKIVLTQGSYDLLHIGHARYFKAAKEHGDVLIVGIDSDEKIRTRKGPDRPIVPQEERIEMVSHIQYVDFVTLKEANAAKWHLIKLIEPDTLIATKETYSDSQLKELDKFCGKVVVLEPQATTSTSAKIRRMQINTAKKLQEKLTPKILKSIEAVLTELKEEKLKK